MDEALGWSMLVIYLGERSWVAPLRHSFWKIPACDELKNVLQLGDQCRFDWCKPYIYIILCIQYIYILYYIHIIYILWVLYNYIKCLKIETTRRSQYLGPSLSWGNVSIAIKCLGCVCNLPNPSDLTVLSLIFLNLPVKPFQTIAVSWFSLGASIFLSTCRQSPETAAFAVSKFLRRVACAQAPRNCWIPWGTLAADFACENQLGIREMCRRTGDGCWISQKQLVLVTCLLSWSKWRDRKRKKKGSVGVWRKSSPFSPGQKWVRQWHPRPPGTFFGWKKIIPQQDPQIKLLPVEIPHEATWTSTLWRRITNWKSHW